MENPKIKGLEPYKAPPHSAVKAVFRRIEQLFTTKKSSAEQGGKILGFPSISTKFGRSPQDQDAGVNRDDRLHDAPHPRHTVDPHLGKPRIAFPETGTVWSLVDDKSGHARQKTDSLSSFELIAEQPALSNQRVEEMMRDERFVIIGRHENADEEYQQIIDVGGFNVGPHRFLYKFVPAMAGATAGSYQFEYINSESGERRVFGRIPASGNDFAAARRHAEICLSSVRHQLTEIRGEVNNSHIEQAINFIKPKAFYAQYADREKKFDNASGLMSTQLTPEQISEAREQQIYDIQGYIYVRPGQDGRLLRGESTPIDEGRIRCHDTGGKQCEVSFLFQPNDRTDAGRFGGGEYRIALSPGQPTDNTTHVNKITTLLSVPIGLSERLYARDKTQRIMRAAATQLSQEQDWESSESLDRLKETVKKMDKSL